MLELKQIGKSFDGVPVLKDISIQVGDGEIVSILGPSGCGKTTLLNIILGILDADAGQTCTMARTSPAHQWKNADSISFFRTMRFSPT